MPDPTAAPRSAEIIAFRPLVPAGKPDAAEAIALAEASAEDPQLRLQRAMVALDDALARQKIAVAEWRNSMSQLGSRVDGLGGALHGLQSSLGGLQTQVTQLHSSAVGLEAQADRLLAATTPA